MAFRLTSPAFSEGQTIPEEYTGDGANLSPPLAWTEPPEGTVAFALVCDDPDAPRRTWVHWVVWNLPGHLVNLEAGIEPGEMVGTQGRNDFGNQGYGGPAPPRGKPHRYYFTLYALDSLLNLYAGATKEQLLSAMKGHVLAETRLMGRYQRRGRSVRSTSLHEEASRDLPLSALLEPSRRPHPRPLLRHVQRRSGRASRKRIRPARSGDRWRRRCPVHLLPRLRPDPGTISHSTVADGGATAGLSRRR